MFRKTQTIPGGGWTFLGIVALSFLAPGWVAGVAGLAVPHNHLIVWMARQQVLISLVLFLLYGLGGFGVLLGVIVAVHAAGLVLLRGLAKAKAWAERTSVKLAALLGEIMYWPVQLTAELLWDIYVTRAEYVAAL